MRLKICTKCNKDLPISDFRKRKTGRNGLNAVCKYCDRDHKNNYYKTRRGLIARIYNNQVTLSKKRGYELPNYSGSELAEYLLSNDTFNKLFDDYVDSGYDRWSAPSCDRIDNYKPYSFDNIIIVSWWQNCDNEKRDMINGVLKKTLVPCVCYNDVAWVEFYSIQHASRVTGADASAIVSACKGNYHTAGGFKWRYADEQN